ncbi:hypothetical protein F383_24337 [Gossypium arboreum]|uniref:Uncharacterized protein n=1 Tax=Gossypium arboreum TaxID=29729 RepID=A0A0B0MPJ3_GOSAR|nr:hypothetical protein F383_24337 [Gossypium arboreum]
MDKPYLVYVMRSCMCCRKDLARMSNPLISIMKRI